MGSPNPNLIRRWTAVNDVAKCHEPFFDQFATSHSRGPLSSQHDIQCAQYWQIPYEESSPFCPIVFWKVRGREGIRKLTRYFLQKCFQGKSLEASPTKICNREVKVVTLASNRFQAGWFYDHQKHFWGKNHNRVNKAKVYDESLLLLCHPFYIYLSSADAFQ